MIAKIGDFSFQISEEKALQIKSLQVFYMCRKKGFSYTFTEIQSKFRLNPCFSSVTMFKLIVLSESLKIVKL